jgi:hypothetical protein
MRPHHFGASVLQDLSRNVVLPETVGFQQLINNHTGTDIAGKGAVSGITRYVIVSKPLVHRRAA